MPGSFQRSQGLGQHLTNQGATGMVGVPPQDRGGEPNRNGGSKPGTGNWGLDVPEVDLDVSG